MPIVFSKLGASAIMDQVPWIDEFIYLAETSQLTPDMKAVGFKAYIPTNDPLLDLTPLEYLTNYRARNIQFVRLTKTTNEQIVHKALKLDMSGLSPTMSSARVVTPSVSLTSPENNTTSRPPLPTRKSSTFHKALMTKLRPLPFQYVWAVWHENPSKAPIHAEPTPTSSPDGITPPTSLSTSTYSTHLTLLADSVPDIGVFYKIYNNFPWESLRLKDSIHIFRAGVKPLWEDPENLDGGAFTLKVRRDDDRAVKAWEEVCLMGCGGELQAALVDAGATKDHVLGMSYSPRLYWGHITIWTKKGDSFKSVEVLERMVLERLSPELRPRSSGEYYYKKHSEHEGWKEAVAGAIASTSSSERKVVDQNA
jgi:Eukaryotic initiation factor 4E